jgi:hypothetical protein
LKPKILIILKERKEVKQWARIDFEVGKEKWGI